MPQRVGDQLRRRLDSLNIPPGGNPFRSAIPSASIAGRILLIQGVVFVVLIALLWLDEYMDWTTSPPTFSSTNFTAINLSAKILLVMVVWLLMVALTGRLLTHIRYIEGLLPICSFCKAIRLDQDWVPLEKYMRSHSATRLTHSVCPSCARRHYNYTEEDS